MQAGPVPIDLAQTDFTNGAPTTYFSTARLGKAEATEAKVKQATKKGIEQGAMGDCGKDLSQVPKICT